MGNTARPNPLHVSAASRPARVETPVMVARCHGAQVPAVAMLLQARPRDAQAPAHGTERSHAGGTQSRRRCGPGGAVSPGADVGAIIYISVPRHGCGRVAAQMWSSRGADVGRFRFATVMRDRFPAQAMYSEDEAQALAQHAAAAAAGNAGKAAPCAGSAFATQAHHVAAVHRVATWRSQGVACNTVQRRAACCNAAAAAAGDAGNSILSGRTGHVHARARTRTSPT